MCAKLAVGVKDQEEGYLVDKLDGVMLDFILLLLESSPWHFFTLLWHRVLIRASFLLATGQTILLFLLSTTKNVMAMSFITIVSWVQYGGAIVSKDNIPVETVKWYDQLTEGH